MSSGIYASNQAAVLFPYWNNQIQYFIVGGPGTGDEAQTIKFRFPQVECIGFEPHAPAYEEQVVRGFPGRLFGSALGERTMSSTLCTPPSSPNSILQSWIKGHCQRGAEVGSEIEVEQVSLDDLYLKHGPWDNSVLWLDIEGSEMAALKGAGLLLHTAHIVNIEVYDVPKDLPEFINYLAPYGLEEVLKWNIQQTFIGTTRADVIFCRR